MTTAKPNSDVCNIPNRTIFEGDNLDIMRGINDACIDLDPRNLTPNIDRRSNRHPIPSRH